MADWELFHRLGEAGSAAVRRWIVAHGRESDIVWRNVHFESHAQALRARGGTRTPALWNGTTLAQGEEACLRHLQGWDGDVTRSDAESGSSD